MTHKIALVGVGEIARNQHFPSINKSPDFELIAAISRNAEVEGVDNFKTLQEALLERPDISSASLCTPPQVRFQYAWQALTAGKHVMLEKPPGATLSEVEALECLAQSKGLTLYATWHSRHAPAVEPARVWLENKHIKEVSIIWKEDVKKWHPGQTWIWQAGGAGVFDPGINALSILTHILPFGIHLQNARLFFPANCQTPIAANLSFTNHMNVPVSAEFDWRQTGPQIWDIKVTTDQGEMILASGGSIMQIDGDIVSQAPEAEYDQIYAHFAQLLEKGQSDVDVTPLRHVADAFMLGSRIEVEPFTD